MKPGDHRKPSDGKRPTIDMHSMQRHLRCRLVNIGQLTLSINNVAERLVNLHAGSDCGAISAELQGASLELDHALGKLQQITGFFEAMAVLQQNIVEPRNDGPEEPPPVCPNVAPMFKKEAGKES
jgi:hypothetical protein